MDDKPIPNLQALFKLMEVTHGKEAVLQMIASYMGVDENSGPGDAAVIAAQTQAIAALQKALLSAQDLLKTQNTIIQEMSDLLDMDKSVRHTAEEPAVSP